MYESAFVRIETTVELVDIAHSHSRSHSHSHSLPHFNLAATASLLIKRVKPLSHVFESAL